VAVLTEAISQEGGSGTWPAGASSGSRAIILNTMPTTDMASAVAALRQRPIPVTEKGFGVIASHGTVTAASLAAQRPSLFGTGFTMPMLVLRERAVAHNLGAMAAYCASAGVKLAPHGKTTMAPQLFARQLAAGAWGITAATIGQVQAYRAFGVHRVLLANELTDQAGIAWLARELDSDPGFECYVYVDSPAGVGLLDDVLHGLGTARPLRVLVELGYPGGRTGCRDVREAADLARAVSKTPSLSLAGAAGFEGLIGHDREAAPVAGVTAFCRNLRALGGELAAGWQGQPDGPVLSAGGSAFFDIVVRELAGGWRDGPEPTIVLRSGVYVAFDHAMYAQMAPAQPAFEPALELWAHVLSVPEPGLALAGAGRRDVSFDAGMPVPLLFRHRDGHTSPAGGATVVSLNDQHAYLNLPAGTRLSPGDLVCLGISHPCTTFDKWRVIPVVDDGYQVIDAIHTFF
jgi:D-serine deaminase-like pyridoxal phosphate-dependent protein